MAKTLAQIEAQIKSLQRAAEAMRVKEASGVIARIQEAIAHYGLTPGDLFVDAAPAPAKKVQPARQASRKPTTSSKPTSAAGAPRYRDESSGKTWTGRGKRPNWFREAIASGKTPADLEIQAS